MHSSYGAKPVSTVRVTKKDMNVKQNFPVDDEAYFSAVESGEMETVQRIVDEAREPNEGYARGMEEDGESEETPSDRQIGEQYDQIAKDRKGQNVG